MRAHEERAGTLDQRILDDIVERILQTVQPERMILFGSAARGEMNRHSDVDILVVKEASDFHKLTGDIYHSLRGVGAAVDIIMVTPDDVERYKDSHPLVIKPALQEGRAVYESG